MGKYDGNKDELNRLKEELDAIKDGAATQKSRISENETERKELERRVVHLEQLLDVAKAENKEIKRESVVLQNEIEALRQRENEEESEQIQSIEIKEVLTKEKEAEFDMFDSLNSSKQISPKKNQIVIGKKELQKLRKKSDQFAQLLSKAKLIKEKNKEFKDEITGYIQKINELETTLEKNKESKDEIAGYIEKINELEKKDEKLEDIEDEKK